MAESTGKLVGPWSRKYLQLATGHPHGCSHDMGNPVYVLLDYRIH